MSNKRFNKYLQQKRYPVNKEDIQKSNDSKIDQDFPGYPFGQSKEEIIKPATVQQEHIAAIHVKDGEKLNKADGGINEQNSDSSGGAFDATEMVRE